MLILRRKVGQSVVVGDDVLVRVVAIKGDEIHLGFDAPKELAIDRSEVRKRKQEAAAAEHQ